MLKTVDEISKPISPKRAGAIATELIALGLTSEQIALGCKRYAMSVASQFREIQISDFTNESITSEMELKEREKALLEREKALQARMDAFEREVERRADEKLNDIKVELHKISTHYPSQSVIASRALYEAMVLLENQKRKEIEALIPKMKQELEQALKVVALKNQVA